MYNRNNSYLGRLFLFAMRQLAAGMQPRSTVLSQYAYFSLVKSSACNYENFWQFEKEMPTKVRELETNERTND